MTHNEQALCFDIAYWKGRWVAVPYFYLPKDAISDKGELMRVKVTTFDNQIVDPIPRMENGAFEKIFSIVKETIVPWAWSEKDLKLLCKRNDLPLAWVTDRFPRKGRQRSEGSNRREERKIRPLTPHEYRKILKELVKINEQAAVVVSILWFLNNSLGDGGGFVTLEEIVRLKIEDVSPEQENCPSQISLIRTGMMNTQYVAHYLPSRLWHSLSQQINPNSIFVFSTKKGGPIEPIQIDTYLKKAAKQAGFKKTITSAAFRPKFNKEQVERAFKKRPWDANVKPYLEPIKLEEWKKIIEHFPSVLERKGRPSVHLPLDLLNAIFYLSRTRCPLRKLPDHFPPWPAVDSQRRRWRKTGVLDSIIDFRKSKNKK